MLMLVEFDIDADIIDVPYAIIENREIYRRRFSKWIHNPAIKHAYWVKFENGIIGLRFRSDAFVEWLNKKILKNSEERATIVEQHVSVENEDNLPSIFF